MNGRTIHYSRAELRFIERRCTMSRRALHAAFLERFGRRDVRVDHVRSLCSRRGWHVGRKPWRSTDDGRLRTLYPDTSTEKVARRLGRTVSATYGRAMKLGLCKSEAYLASPAACRLRRGDNIGAAHRFLKGHVPANKGLRRPGYAPGRMRETQFKKGQRGWNWKPLGSERLVDGYRYTKVSDRRRVPWTANWKPTHFLKWEAKHGPVPRGYALLFRDGDRTNVRLRNLKLITRRELMLRNSVHNLPAPLPQTIQLLGALKRKINRRTRDEEQDRGPAESPVRDARGAVRSGQADGDRARASDRRRVAGGHRLREGGDRVHQSHQQQPGNGVHSAPARIRGAVRPASRRRRLAAVVARGPAPWCRQCGAALAYQGRGRPAERCRPRCVKASRRAERVA